MERLKNMKECLSSLVMAQMSDLKNADAKELGEAVDMIKDLSEAIYYCTITEAMKKEEEKPQHRETRYFTERIREPYFMDRNQRYMDNGRMFNDDGRMYYGGNSSNGGNNNGGSNGSSMSSSGGRSNYHEYELPLSDFRDPREGRSYLSRRMYMESKEMGRDKLGSIQDLEHYMSELSEDITDMIKDASQEEKQVLQNKLNKLAQKISNANG